MARTVVPRPARPAAYDAPDNTSFRSSEVPLSLTDRLAVTGLAVLFVLAVLAAKPDPAFS